MLGLDRINGELARCTNEEAPSEVISQFRSRQPDWWLGPSAPAWRDGYPSNMRY